MSNGEYYDGAMVKVRGEDSAGGTSESDIELDDAGFCSDGSVGGWTTRSVSRLGDRHSPPTTSPPPSGGTVEEKQEAPRRQMPLQLPQDQQKPPLPSPISPPASRPSSPPPPPPSSQPSPQPSQPPQPKAFVPKPVATISESAMSTSSESESESSEAEEAEVGGPWLPPKQSPSTCTPPDTGYPLVAKTMSATPSLQIYRRFSALNHRILLYMQDEIAELSAMLDKLDAQSGPAARHRRGMQGNPHGEQRLQLLNTIAWKVGQYSMPTPTLGCPKKTQRKRTDVHRSSGQGIPGHALDSFCQTGRRRVLSLVAQRERPSCAQRIRLP